MRKQTVDSKIMESIRITSKFPSRIKKVELVEPVLMNIYQSHAYRNDFRWLHFDDEPRVQERQQVKDQQSHISVFIFI